MRRQMLKILAGHVMWGGLRPPPCCDSSCGPLVFSAFASACIFCFCPILYFLLSAHIVLSAECTKHNAWKSRVNTVAKRALGYYQDSRRNTVWLRNMQIHIYIFIEAVVNPPPHCPQLQLEKQFICYECGETAINPNGRCL